MHMILLYDSSVNHIIRDFVLLHSSVLQCVAVCCSVLQCVAVCCSVLQALQDILENCVIRLYCMILDSIIMFISACVAGALQQHTATFLQQHTATHLAQEYVNVLQCVAVCCSVLQCVAVCCSVLQCVAVCDMYRRRNM